MPPPHDEYTRQILSAIEAGGPVSQRSLSRQLGVALGLTNLLIRRLVKKGFVKVMNLQPNRVRYLITPAGIAEKSRITCAYLENTVRLYTHTREEIRASFQGLSAAWPEEPGANGHGEKRIVFYGAGEVAEIGYISLQATDLQLAGVVDDFVTRPFFGLPVHRPEALGATLLNGQPFSLVVLMSFRKADQMRARLEMLGFPSHRVCALLGSRAPGEQAS